MGITRREAKEIVDWVVSEVTRRSFAYSTDGKLDFGKGRIGGGTISGTPTIGGDIANGAIWNRHVNANADIQGTKVRIATTSERGTVQLASNMESSASKAVKADDDRLHSVVVSGATEHDTRYYTQDQLMSGILNSYYDDRYYTQTSLNSTDGASFVGVEDSEGVFSGTTVEDVLYELFLVIGAKTFVDLVDTPDDYANKWFPHYGKVAAVNKAGDGIVWRPKDYIDGGSFTDTYYGAIDSKLVYVDGGSFTGYEIINGGTF